MMEIVKATKEHRAAVLKLLDGFRDSVIEITAPESKTKSKTARTTGARVFDAVIESPNSAIFLAAEKSFVGIITINMIPVIRRGAYYAEIEDFYVVPKHRGRGVAKALMASALEWARANGARCVRLESHRKLERAHAFYVKAGFMEYGKAFEKRFE